MKVLKTRELLKKEIQILRNKQLSVGFVPTMGALHEGHEALFKKARRDNDIMVCSIFVNPLQFNDKSDLLNYPKTLGHDKIILQKNDCDILFLPSVDVIYPEGEKFNFKIEISSMDSTMEGKVRPGHFIGVAKVVLILLDLIKPDKAYFGEKDFQQLAVIKKVVEDNELDVKIISVETVRDEDGLAKSSRNRLLTVSQRTTASVIPKALSRVKRMSRHQPVDVIKNWIKNYFSDYENEISLDYFEICDPEHLAPLIHLKKNTAARAFIAARLGNIRLIDNVLV